MISEKPSQTDHRGILSPALLPSAAFLIGIVLARFSPTFGPHGNFAYVIMGVYAWMIIAAIVVGVKAWRFIKVILRDSAARSFNNNYVLAGALIYILFVAFWVL